MKKQPKDTPVKAESDLLRHRTLEDRAAEYDGKLNLDGELDWRGAPVGYGIW